MGVGEQSNLTALRLIVYKEPKGMRGLWLICLSLAGNADICSVPSAECRTFIWETCIWELKMAPFVVMAPSIHKSSLENCLFSFYTFYRANSCAAPQKQHTN
jgi:hypothetical protein